jgi:hypothetical protein
MKVPLLGPTGGEREDDVSYQLTQNWYPHVTADSKSKLVLYPTPGLSLFSNTGSGPIRGSVIYNDKYYAVSSNRFIEVASDASVTDLGTLDTFNGKVSMAHNGSANGQQIIIADGTEGYIYDFEFSTFAKIELKASGTAQVDTANKLDTTGSSGDFINNGVVAGMVVYNTTDGTQGIVGAVDSADVLSIVDANGDDLDLFPDGDEDYEVGDDGYPSTATHVQFMDGYFLANDPTNSGRFYISAGYQGYDWNGLDFATAERSPDELQAIVVSNRNLWLIGTHTSELWYNSGATDFPFAPMQGGFSQWGTIAPWSAIEISGATFWLTQNDEGVGQVIMTDASAPRIVSTPAINAEISKLTTLDDAYAWAYQYQGHTFYVLSFPTEQRTFVYDVSFNLWHEWKTESTGYHRSNNHQYVYGKHLIGDPVNGKIYYLDWDKYTDNGEQITRLRRSLNIQAEDNQLRHYAIHLDIKEGVGNSDITDPSIHMRWRDNNGAWSNYYTRSMGKVGDHQKKVVWRRLGRSAERVYEFRVTDPCNAVLIDAYGILSEDEREVS